ncbi:MAG: putative amidohydrolase YtcJ [Planctomycetota bacterium]|jgi:predicted amidohydrolase YtcJ
MQSLSLQLSAVLFLTLALGACVGPDPFPDEVDPRDLAAEWALVSGGSIWTSATATTAVDAVLARDGIVVAVGGMEEVLDSLPEGVDVTRVNLAGGVAVPGLVDAHGHLFNLGAQLENVDLIGCASFAEVVQRVTTAAKGRPEGTWILGRGWDQTLWPEPSFPHHGELSDALPDHPVLLTRVDGHALIANRAVLALADLDRAYTQEPVIEGGRMLLDDENLPTGVFIDAAMRMVRSVLPQEDQAALEARALKAQERLLSVGLVAIHEMGLAAQQIEILESLESQGLLRVRVIGYLWGNEPIAQELLDRYPGERDLDPAARLRIIGAKLMLDGAMGSRGAALLEPYSDAPTEQGLMRMDADAFQARLAEVAGAGLQPATHAIGDRANRLVLDAYAARMGTDAGFRALRPRIEHAQLVSLPDLRRFGELGIIPSMQPTHCTSDMRWVETRVGTQRAGGAYAWKTLGSSAAPLAFGSDCPVERPDPLEGIYAARTRMDKEGVPLGGWFPDERMNAAEALAGFTTGAAFAANEDSLRGKIEPGRALDLSVFDVNPLCGDAEVGELLRAKALMVLINGKVEFQR